MNENEAKGLASRLISGESGNLTVETNDKLWQVANEEMSLKDFLNDYGHRAVGEFELAEPRWREDTTYLKQIIQSYSQLKEKPTNTSESKNQHFKRQREQRETAQIELNKLLETHKKLKKQIEIELDYTRRYMPFRETAKFYLMLGYEQIRRTLIELDSRYKLEGDIFYLLPDELEGLINGKGITI